MEQNSGSQNADTGFFQQNMVPIIVVVLIAVLAIIYFVSRGNDSADERGNEQTEQTGGDNQNGQNQNQNGAEPTPTPATQGQAGNVNVQGTLRQSDSPARGNLMVESSQGNIYIQTGRDFSNLVGQQVTLNAQGSLRSFTFLGFNGSTVASANTDGEGASTDRNVSFTGTLQVSNGQAGNYAITSGNTVVHLQSAHDYSAWAGSRVTLHASGSLDSFENAVLVK
jgi:hypothetical protein